ncbi:MAG: transposase [Pirellulaceae bacterium]|nr:transposase [Pirellulaceae bacterium]
MTNVKPKQRQNERRSEAFKREAVRKMETRGELSIEEVASSLGVRANQLYNWRMQYGSQIAGTAMETPEAELQRLRRELRQVREERDILKKATAFFARVNS